MLVISSLHSLVFRFIRFHSSTPVRRYIGVPGLSAWDKLGESYDAEAAIGESSLTCPDIPSILIGFFSAQT